MPVAVISIAETGVTTGGTGRLAGRLWGGIAAEVERGGFVGQWETVAATVRADLVALAADGFEVCVAEGRALSLDAVIEEGLREAQPRVNGPA